MANTRVRAKDDDFEWITLVVLLLVDGEDSKCAMMDCIQGQKNEGLSDDMIS